MSKPSPYCECHKWDQPGGICAYCVGYADGWTTETAALRRERDALAARVEALRSGVLDIRYAAYEVTLRGEGEHPAVVCARVLEADTAAAGKGVG